MSIAIGQVLSGKYRLEASIGRGGMGEVFSASHLGTGTRVAVKVVSRAILSDVLMQRLHREAIAAGRIRSDYVPQVFDVDRTDEGELFLVMELLRGQALSERLKSRDGVLTWEEVRRIGEDVLSGLIDAHAAGVVHRDLKPGNIFLEEVVTGGVVARERARILDFGVAKMDSPDAEKLTTTGESVGTITYMAPEQIRGASKVDERADLYSFAMVAFECLAGRIPYDAQGQIAIIASKLERNARTLKDLALVACPPGLDALLAKGLARKPADRFASAEEMMRAWRALGAPTTVPRAVPFNLAKTLPEPATATGMTTMGQGGARVIAYSSRASRVALAVAAFALVAASVVLTFAMRVSPTRAAAASEAPSDDTTTSEAVTNAAPADTTSDSPPTTIELSDDALVTTDPPEPPAPASTPPASDPRPTPAPSRPAHAGHPRRPPRAPGPATSQAPHITTEPRY